MIAPFRAARAAAWALGARRAAQRQIADIGKRGLPLPRAPRLGLQHTRWVSRVLWHTDATCLVRSAVLQRWYADHGREYDLVIGVTAPSKGFRAHAWLDTPEPDPQAAEFTEMTRLAAQDVAG